MNEKIKIIYEVCDDDFEGQITITIQEVIVEFSKFRKELNLMAEASDGERTLTPICAFGVKSRSRYNLTF